jgi:Mrp family chromosome partitioning ATPase
MAVDWLKRLLGLKAASPQGPAPSPEAQPVAPPPPEPAAEAPAKPAKPKKTPQALPDWHALVATRPELWAQALETAKGGKRVLMASAIGGQPQFTVVEAALAVAMTLRGAKVDLLICDGAMPACQRAKVVAPPPPDLAAYAIYDKVCPGCTARGRKVFDVPGLDRL